MFFYRGKTIDQIMNHTLVSKKTHEYNGKMYTVDELTKLLGISYYRLKYAFQHGISIEQVINNNVRFRYDKQLYGNVYKYNGEIGTIRFFANKYNITLSALRQRMKKYNHDIKKCIELKMNI